MRYRPLGNTGMAVSAVSLLLGDSSARPRAADWVALIYAALENGVNAFSVVGQQAALIEGASQAFKAIDRRLIFVAWRLGWSISHSGAIVRDFAPDALENAVESAIARTGLEYLDAGILDDPDNEELAPQALESMRRMREQGKIRLLGVSGQDANTDAYISTGAFDLLATSFSLASGWKERLRLKAAIERDMAVIGYGYCPDGVAGGPAAPQGQKSLWGGGRSGKEAAMGGAYGFLQATPHWTAEEICLGYALTEPSLCAIEVQADRVDRLESLAAIPDRDLPPGIPAQIEMARFTRQPEPKEAKRA
jgi:aryl-alcohol dehydrogenase-like predicted oxidoreductase